MTAARDRASAVATRIRRYGDTKRGPIHLRYLVADRGLRIEASSGDLLEATEIAPAQLQGDEGVAKAMEGIETVLRRVRNRLSRARVGR